VSHGPPRELGDAPSLVLDGEIAIFDSQLISRFEWRRARLKNEVATPPMYMVLDLLELGGEDLRTQPLQERRQALEQLVADRSRVRPAVTPPIWLDEHGQRVPTRRCFAKARWAKRKK
jgi:ATP-dependent DNA ligase